MSSSWLTGARQLIEDNQIEIFERPSPNPGVYGNPGASPEQLEFQEAFFSGKYRILAAAGGNQSGKTTGAAGMTFCKHLRDHAKNGQAYWIMAATSQTLRDIPCKTLWQFLPRSMFGDVEYSPQTGFGLTHTINLKLPRGRGNIEIWLWTEEMSLQIVESARLAGFWWTECFREAIYGAIHPRLAAQAGFLIMDYVPKLAWHRTRIRLRSKIESDLYWHLFTMPGNAHNMPPGEIERQRKRMTTNEWQMRGLGRESLLEGLVYPQFIEERHLLAPFKIPKDWPRWRMLDYGYAAPTAVAWGAIAPIGWMKRDYETLIIYREYYERGKSVPENAMVINMRSAGETYHRRMLIDPHAFDRTPNNPQSIAEQYSQSGIDTIPWPRTTRWGEDAMVEMVRKSLEDDRLLVFSNCAHTIAEFQTWSYRRTRDGLVDPSEKYEKDHNHLLDAIRGWIATHPVHTQISLEPVDAPDLWG